VNFRYMKAPLPIASSSPLPLFVYGTLMAPAVVETLIQRPIQGRPANLISSSKKRSRDDQEYEYSRHPVLDQAYPGLVNWTTQPSFVKRSSIDNGAGHTSLIRGLLYSDLTDEEMEQLDFFEGDQYGKELCYVQLVAGSSIGETDGTSSNSSDKTIQALVYVWTNPVSELDITQDWSFDNFVQKRLSDYVVTNVQPCRDNFLE
jgi:Gamma-glutamyl cyclotransferase, AIG2-like